MYIVILILLTFTFQPGLTQGQPNFLNGKTICIDPGHGGTAGRDSYRVGPTGEREEWINLRVGLALKQLLEKRGANVVMTREEDADVPLQERVRMALEHEADVFVSIHHNATADSSVNFPIVYVHGNASENKASVMLGKLLIESLSKALYNDRNPASLASDLVIFPGSGTAVLRGTYGIPAVLAEASFFTNPQEEKRLKNSDYNHREAQAYLKALQLFFSKKRPPVQTRNSRVQADRIEPFQVFREEERMKPAAKQWKANFAEGYRLYQTGDSLSLRKVLEFFTLSVRSFPDSWLARQAHSYRAKIFRRIEKYDKQQEAENRAAEFYIPLRRNDQYLKNLKKVAILT